MNSPRRTAIAAVCAIAASAAVVSSASAYFTGYIQSPSQNILCALDQGKAWCMVGNLGKEVWINSSGSYRVTGRTGDVGDVKIRTLPYGQEIDARWISCVSRTSGMLCYSRVTGKGVLMNRSGITRK